MSEPLESYRNTWTSTVDVSDVEKAATEKVEFHSKRKAWWTTKKNEIVEEMRSSGIKISETIVEELGKLGYSNSTVGNRQGVSVSIDSKLQERLGESMQKIDQHTKKESSYIAWVSFLSTVAADTQMTLTMDDYSFFFGANTSPSEQ